MSTLEKIQEAEQNLAYARMDYLIKTGWKQICDLGDSGWYWSKTLDDGRIVALSPKNAVDFERNKPE